MGVQVDYQDQVLPADAEAVMRLYADKGYNMILAHSFDYGGADNKTARDFPNVMFGWATGYTNFGLKKRRGLRLAVPPSGLPCGLLHR